MHAVLYTNNLEPITVVDIPMWLWSRLAEGQCIRIAVMEPLTMASFIEPPKPPAYTRAKTVEIFGETIERRGQEAMMLFTADEENALLLKAEFLPGQRGELQNKQRSAFARGFLHALQNCGDKF